jgi:omega-6 fatty acid desaturase (delta-12 desaturase)
MQIVTTVPTLIATFALMYLLLPVSYLLVLLLALPAAGLLVRSFIIMHDCGHGSFFASRRANAVVGWITGILTITPFDEWRRDHALHHASSGDLDRRGNGDVHTLTVREYRALPWNERMSYWLFRHPAVMFGLGPISIMLKYRFSKRGPMSTQQSRRSVLLTNLAILAIVSIATVLLGWRFVVLVYLPSMYLAAAAGILLFFVQHQFEETYWKDHQEWDYASAAIRGSSYLRLHPVLRWFTGSIGLHHVHHLGPRIPNYQLKRCHDENPFFHDVTVLSLRQSLRMLPLALWDEERERLISFRELRRSGARKARAA